MKKNLFSLTLVMGISLSCFAQVGIGTENPQATLDVNGNVKIRSIPEVTSLTGEHYILVMNQSESGDDEITQISSANFTTSATAYAAENEGGWSLLDLVITGTNWTRINLSSGDTTIGNPAHFVNGTYTAPSSGVYMVNYEFQLQSGVNINLLGEKRLGIIKNGEVIQEKEFDAVRVVVAGIINLATVPVTSTNLSSLVQLNAGETLTFAVDTGGVDLGLLSDNKVSLYVYKVSN